MIPVLSTWIKANSMGCSSAILHGLTHNCSSRQAGGKRSWGISSSCPQQCFRGGWKEEQFLSSYLYISWRLSGTKTWVMKKFTGMERKVYKGKGLILCHSFSDLDTDLFICSLASSFPHRFRSLMAGAEAAEDIAFPWKSLEENSTHSKKKQQPEEQLCYDFFMPHHFCMDNQTPQPQPVSG